MCDKLKRNDGTPLPHVHCRHCGYAASTDPCAKCAWKGTKKRPAPKPAPRSDDL